jgi:TPP-dependent 2-oxoacid decarboxylase
MDIKWRHDIDRVLSEATEQKRPVLLDFSAAPM